MNCEFAQQEIAVSVLTKSELDPAVAEHASTCPECAAERARLIPMGPLLGTVAPGDLQLDESPSDELLLQRLLGAAAAEHRARHRRSLVTAVVGAAAAVLIGAVAIFAIFAANQPADQVRVASASANGIQATAQIEPSGSGSTMSISIKGVPTGTHCMMWANSNSSAPQLVADWRAEYDGTATVSGNIAAAPESITNVRIKDASGPVLLDIPIPS